MDENSGINAFRQWEVNITLLSCHGHVHDTASTALIIQFAHHPRGCGFAMLHIFDVNDSTLSRALNALGKDLLFGADDGRIVQMGELCRCRLLLHDLNVIFLLHQMKNHQRMPEWKV